jgi:lipopolysaccharide/colanic/teichoic acid biosynthesis glycosyltransferase
VTEIVECRLRGIAVEDWPRFYEKLTGTVPLDHLRSTWLVFCLAMLPLRVVAAVAIRLESPGPVIVGHERTGQVGRVFHLFRFRSSRAGGAPTHPGRLPGITGWARVNNADTSSDENNLAALPYDLYYVKNMAISLDLLILLRAVQLGRFTRGFGAWTDKRHPSTTSVSYAA